MLVTGEQKIRGYSLTGQDAGLSSLWRGFNSRYPYLANLRRV